MERVITKTYDKIAVETVGQQIYALAERLFPICRSLTGQGVVKTLQIIQEFLPDLEIKQVPTGTACFDWEVPMEWNIRDAYIVDPQGHKIVDFNESNLHVVGYSVPVDREYSLSELDEHLHSLPEQPDAIPYITSYYKERWGFCLTHRQREVLKPGTYRVVIDSTLEAGCLTYGEVILPGQSEKELFLSTYVCHPSMANNELSGPTVTAYLLRYLAKLKRRKYTVRAVFIPETIGSISYLSKHIEEMKKKIVAGFNVTCVGDNRTYSFLPSRSGGTLADQAARNVLKHHYPAFKEYSYLDRGSDERQYCSPGVDLPVASVMRSKYATYPEYHTSKDDLSLISPDGLEGGFTVLRKCLDALEHNRTYRVTVLCEPQLGKRGLYPTLSKTGSGLEVRNMMDLLAFCDGKNSLLDISDIIDVSMEELTPIVSTLVDHGLLEEVPDN